MSSHYADRERADRWDNFFLDLALRAALISKDPNTQVGAVAVRDRHPIAIGFNGFPEGVEDLPERLNDRDTKLRLIVHAEQNVIAQAAKRGLSLDRCTMYVACTDISGAIWGGPPCDERCMPMVIQAGVISVVTRPRKTVSKWTESLQRSIGLMQEVGISYREMPLP